MAGLRGKSVNSVTGPHVDAVHRVVAILAVLIVGANIQIKFALSHLTFARLTPIPPLVFVVGIVPVVLLLPVWVSVLKRYRLSRALMVTAGVAVGWGVLLASFAKTDHLVSSHQVVPAALMVVAAFGGIGVLLWAGEALRPETVAVVFGIGLTAAQALDRATWAPNPWKYGFAFPVAVIAVGLASRVRSPWPGVVALSVVGLVSVFSGYRSFAGFCVVTILVMMWQTASGSQRARVNSAAPLLMLAAVGMGVYAILSNLLVGGYLGAGLQERSVAQIEASGSLIIGGRPEWVATLRLMSERPQGFGFGVIPNAVDVGQGDAGLQSVNIDPAFGYETYMFGGGFRLHSIVADLWAAAGWGGLLLSAAVLFILLLRLTTVLSARSATPLVVLTTVIAVWSLAFGPIFTDLKSLTLATFVALSAQRLNAEPAQQREADRGAMGFSA